jgi:hypothetical protein
MFLRRVFFCAGAYATLLVHFPLSRLNLIYWEMAIFYLKYCKCCVWFFFGFFGTFVAYINGQSRYYSE